MFCYSRNKRFSLSKVQNAAWTLLWPSPVHGGIHRSWEQRASSSLGRNLAMHLHGATCMQKYLPLDWELPQPATAWPQWALIFLAQESQLHPSALAPSLNMPPLLLAHFPGGSEVKASACNAGDLGSIPGSGRSPGEGTGNPLQYSCLENPIDGEAWWATVHGVAKSRTRLSDFTFTAGTQLVPFGDRPWVMPGLIGTHRCGPQLPSLLGATDCRPHCFHVRRKTPLEANF